MPDFTFSLNEDQLRIWQAYADKFDYTFDYLVETVIPKTLTQYLLLNVVGPDWVDDLTEATLDAMPEGARDNFIAFIENLKQDEQT